MNRMSSVQKPFIQTISILFSFSPYPIFVLQRSSPTMVWLAFIYPLINTEFYRILVHNSLFYDKCQTLPAMILALSWKKTCEDDTMIPHSLCASFKSASLYCVLSYRLQGGYPNPEWIEPDLTRTWDVGHWWNCLDEPVFMTGPKPMLTEYGIYHRFESSEFI